jgi:hypothetical protein
MNITIILSNLEPIRKAIVSSGILLLFALKGFAQIQGGVYDEKKQGIPNALLIARDTTVKILDSVSTNKRGYYSFKSLKKGKYNIEVKASGFNSRIYESIEVINEEPLEKNAIRDISGATRLEIFLTPVKVPK